MANWLNLFLRVNNRKKRFTYLDALKAGYPMVEIGPEPDWQKLHQLCSEYFKNSKGDLTYVWFGHRFFFLNQDDAHLFKTLLYLV